MQFNWNTPRRGSIGAPDWSLSVTSSCSPPSHDALFCFPRQKTFRDFRLQGVLDATLNNKSYETIYNRLTVEEATAAVKSGDGLQGISMRDSDEEED